ncbi:MAG: rhodanese-like domain-containing protein [Candidatus Aminicenantes bacterium]|nr:rhodanese-like domain-containing protein [Candidatus Aminicenantes bacterium]
MTLKKFIMQASIILAMSIIAGVAYNGFSESPLPIFKKYVPVEAESRGEDDLSDGQPVHVSEIDIDTLKYLVESGEALLIDARTGDDFSRGYLPGAVSLPAYEFDRVFKEVEGLLDEEKTIITYCSSVTCIDSTLLAKKLYRSGFQNIFVYRGGLKEWTELDNPVEIPHESK